MMRKWIPFWVLPFLVAFSIGTVWLRLFVVQSTYEINQTDKMLTNIRHESERLELEIAQLRSPMRLEGLARKKFHLRPPRMEQVIQMGSDEK